MSNRAQLSILIPAWKSHFLAQTLESVAAAWVPVLSQVWIFDDGAPPEIQAICQPFLERFPSWQYLRFEENLGSRDLVAHWNRCVAQTPSDWVWLFSDDDLMEPGSVQAFFETQNRFPGTQVFRFRQNIVNEQGQHLEADFPIPDPVSGEELGKLRFQRKLYSSAVAYIFARKAFDENQGFVPFPLAWCSDDASWISFAGKTGIRTIPEGGVSWRISPFSISGENTTLCAQKMEAAIDFVNWYNQRFPHTCSDTSFRAEQVIWLRLQLSHMGFFPGFLKVIFWISKLRLPSLSMRIRAFGDLYGLSYVYFRKVLQGNKKARGFRALVHWLLPKF
jgi:hypothetical protein